MNPAPPTQSSNNPSASPTNLPSNNPQPTPQNPSSFAKAPEDKQPITQNQPPTTNYPPPTTNHQHHFPFMIITLFLALIIAGFASSYLFFSFTTANPLQKSNSPNTPATILITPPVTIFPSVSNEAPIILQASESAVPNSSTSALPAVPTLEASPSAAISP